MLAHTMTPPSTPYDWEHQQTKAKLLPEAYNTACPRCQKLMLKGQDLDLGHSEDLAVNPNAKGDRIEHADCNRSAGGKLGTRQVKFRPSRSW